MLLTLDYFIDVDSDHSSTFDVMDTDQNRLDVILEMSDVNVSSAKMAATTTPTTVTSLGKIRRCSCGRRMSSLSYDHHSLCSICRGFDCTLDSRCEECELISDEQFNLYFKHQRSLKSKVLSRQRSRSRLRSTDTPLPPRKRSCGYSKSFVRCM